MLEPLSIATGVVALLKSTWTVGAELKKFHDGVSTIDKTLHDIGHDVDGLASVLKSMRDTFETITAVNGTGDLAAHWTNVAKAIEHGNGIIRELGEELQKIGKTPRFLDSSRKQLRLNLAEDKLAVLGGRVQSLRETLQLSLQVITVTQQASHEGALIELCQEIRRLAEKINGTIEKQQAVVQSQEDEAQVRAMMDLRECVRSAASVVSSASSGIVSLRDNRHGTSVMSDFGDCFPTERNVAIKRWMETHSVQDYEQGQSTQRPQSAYQATSSISELTDGSDSEVDLEDESTTLLLEDGQQKLADGEWADAERVLQKCSLRLSNVAREQQGGYAMKQHSKHAEVLQCLLSIYIQQERWTEAHTTLSERLKVHERMGSKKDVNYFRDVAALARTLQQRKESVQALLHARRALRGFKKLQASYDIRSCLKLLIELCRTRGVDDDEEVYILMLSRIAVDVPRPDEDVSSEIATQRQSYGSSTTQTQLLNQGDIDGSIGENASYPFQELIKASKDKSQHEERSFSVLEKKYEGSNDVLPHEVRTNTTTHSMGGKFREDLFAEGEAGAQVQAPYLSGSEELHEAYTEGSIDDNSVSEGQTGTSEAPVAYSCSHDVIDAGNLGHEDVLPCAEKCFDAPTISEHQEFNDPDHVERADFDHTTTMNPEEFSSCAVIANDGTSPVDNPDDLYDADDWALSAPAAIAGINLRQQPEGNHRVGCIAKEGELPPGLSVSHGTGSDLTRHNGTASRSSSKISHDSEQFRTSIQHDASSGQYAENQQSLDDQEVFSEAQTEVTPAAITSSDIEIAASSQKSFSLDRYVATDNGVNLRVSSTDQTPSGLKNDYSGNIDNTGMQDMLLESPKSERYFPESPSTPYKFLPSTPPSTVSNTVASKASLATSDTNSIAYTNDTVLSDLQDNEPESHDGSRRRVDTAVDPFTEPDSLYNVLFKTSQGLRADVEKDALTHKRSWTQEAAEYELLLTGQKPATSSFDLQESIESRGLSHSTSALDVEETQTRSNTNRPSSTPPTTPDCSNSNTHWDKDSHNKKEQNSQKKATRAANIALIGDGLCGKTSLMQ